MAMSGGSANLFARANFLLGASSPKQFPPPAVAEVAFAGPSNVGKSSLLNALTRQKKLAIVSATPGRTREINFFDCAGRFRIVDLPGYGYAATSKETSRRFQQLTAEYLAKRENLALVVCLFDARRDPSERDLSLIDWLVAHERRILPVATKIDKLKRNERPGGLARIARGLGIDAANIVPTSAQTGAGIDELRNLIRGELK